MKTADRIRGWLHWHDAHRRTSRGEDFGGYVDRISGRHHLDVTFDDIRFGRCEEIGGRLRIPRR